MEVLRKIGSFLVNSLQLLLVLASLLLVVYIFVFRPYQVDGESMFPTFKDKEIVITNLLALRLDDITRGDVIVFNAPLDPEKDYIKRVVGLPKDTIMIQNGSVFVNGKLFDEHAYLRPEVRTYTGSFVHEGETITVPNESYFVMGDNRPYSSDSREWGFVKKNELIGKSFFRIWPFSSLLLVKNPFLH